MGADFNYNELDMMEYDNMMQIMITFWIVGSVIMLIASIPYIIGLWRLYEKAGEKGWKCLIPIYNSYILYKIVYGNGWKFLLQLIPLFNVAVTIAFWFRLGQVFGKSTAFGVGLFFLSYIFVLILSFDDSRYGGPLEDVFI